MTPLHYFLVLAALAALFVYGLCLFQPLTDDEKREAGIGRDDEAHELYTRATGEGNADLKAGERPE